MPSTSQVIQFAQFIVTGQVFYTTRLSAALVNLKPILPGHSLVIPRRVVPRYADLSVDEV
jgi:bis(5'-adenosyl)-triphosphatase